MSSKATEAGYLVLELEHYKVAYNDAIADPPQFHLDLELLGDASGSLIWSSTSNALVSTPEATSFLEQKEDGSSFAGSICTVGCNSFQRTNFIDMTDELINSFINSTLKISIVTVGKPVVTEVKKGAPPPEPVDIKLAEVYFPLSSLIEGNQTFIEYSYSLDELKTVQPKNITHPLINGAQTSLVMRLSLDNGFAEYIAGGNVFQSDGGSVNNIPLAWAVPIGESAAQIAAKKAASKKGAVPLTEQQLRDDSLTAIANSLATQSSQVLYSMVIEAERVSPETNDEEKGEVTDIISNLGFQKIVLSAGRLHFDTAAAGDTAVSEERPLEGNASLWSLKWESSNMIFMHRSKLNSLADIVKKGKLNFNVVISKSTVSAQKIGEDLIAQARIDGSIFNIPKETNFPINFSPSGSGLEVAGATGSTSLTFGKPPVPSNALKEDSGISPVDVISLKSISLGGAGNRDVKKELRQEISDIVKEIAQEYVGLYPQPPSKPLQSHSGLAITTPGLEDISIEARKSHFMHYLSTHGIYHRFKEVLKPRIQRYARERYGARNRALGKSGPYVDSAGYTEESKVPLDSMISELYLLLTRECNTVLNAMYKSTIIDRDTQELEKMPLIDDEVETPKQKFMRLHKLAADATADANHYRAEQFHLERIQMVQYEISLKTDSLAPHHAFFQFYDYLIRRSAEQLLSFRNSDVFTNLSDADKFRIPSEVEFLRDKARQALESSSQKRSDDWMTMMQMGLLLLETDQPERAGEFLLRSVQVQLSKLSNKSNKDFTLDEFQGYESDQICPVHPLTYVALSLYYSKSELPLETRKAIRLAVKSFAEGNYTPSVKEHGKPRRTAVLCMAQAALFMYDRGLTELGDMCTQFAIDCDEAVSRKARERNLAFDTVPFISHLLKQAKAWRLLYQGQGAVAMKTVEESVAISATVEHRVQGCLTAVKGVEFSLSGDVDENKIGWYRRALDFIIDDSDGSHSYDFIPLSGYVELGKLLILQNRFEEALNAMLYGCKVYPSATLFNLVGICCLRLDRLQDAEDALQEANLIDNRNPNVWAYLCVMCLHSGSQRMEEAEKSLDQSLRLGLTNVGVLREMATSYIAVDKLQTAENLIRRALANERESGKSNPHTRRLLGDVLAGQNQAAQAIDEYQSVIEDDTADREARILAGEKCSQLLHSLGRNEEKRTVEEILEALENVEQ